MFAFYRPLFELYFLPFCCCCCSCCLLLRVCVCLCSFLSISALCLLSRVVYFALIFVFCFSFVWCCCCSFSHVFSTVFPIVFVLRVESGVCCSVSSFLHDHITSQNLTSQRPPGTNTTTVPLWNRNSAKGSHNTKEHTPNVANF